LNFVIIGYPHPNTMHNSTDLTIYIPRVSATIPRQKIFEIFSNLKVGFIDKIIEYPLKNDATTKRVLVKFKTWVNNKNSQIIMARFSEDRDIKIVYDDPWFWTAYKWINQTPANDALTPTTPDI
jgi:hypothetical protein